MLPPLTIFLYPNFACMPLTAALSRLPTSPNIQRTTIVRFVFPAHFTSWMLRDL
jgi:hypothetical protein